ncbi:MAG: hypothetical protein M3Y56_09375 [Armatimonadota bacterium]|nr:hypothetical protein [Armatimonadota bacterium]
MDQALKGPLQEVRPGQVYREPDGDEIAILRLEGSSVLCSFDGQQQTELPLDWFYGSQVRLVHEWALCGDYPGDDQ